MALQQLVVLLASLLVLVNAACVPGPDGLGTVLPAGCEVEYLRDYLGGLFRENFNPQLQGPTQWAAMGINMRVSTTDTDAAGVPTTQTIPNVWQPAEYEDRHFIPTGNPANPWIKHPVDLYGPFPSGRTFWLRSFLRPTIPADLIAGQDHGNVLNNGGPTTDFSAHTERQIRNQIRRAFTPVEYVRSVYLYTYSTPCFAGCRNDVFGVSAPIDRSLMAALQQRDPVHAGDVRTFFLGFDTQYEGNDDLQVWLGYPTYMLWPPTAQNLLPTDTTPNRWRVIPLLGSFQELLVNILMDTGFCGQCRFHTLSFPAFTPDLSNHDYVVGSSNFLRAKAISFLVETMLYLVADIKIGEIGTLAQALNSDRVLAGNNKKLRDPADWVPLLQRISAVGYRPRVANIFNDALRWHVETPGERKLDSQFFYDIGNRIYDEGQLGYGRKVPLAPPTQKRGYFPSNAQFTVAGLTPAVWPVRCAADLEYTYSGKLCETRTAIVQEDNRNKHKPPAMNRGTGRGRGGARGRGRARADDDTLPANWSEYTGTNTTIVPGIFLAYSNNALSPDEVLFIGGGIDVKSEIIKFKKQMSSSGNNKILSGVKGILYTAVANAGLAEINGYVYLLKTVFCTMADAPENGGAVIMTRCHKDLNGTAVGEQLNVPSYFNNFLLGRFTNTTIDGVVVPSIPQRLLNAPGPVQSAAYTGTQCLLYTIDPTATPEPTAYPEDSSSEVSIQKPFA